MTSDCKFAANRRNSRQSTGPRSTDGKKRVRRNALRHGLSAVTLSAPTRSAEVERLAAAICGKDADPGEREQARVIAECEFTLLRVRKARLDLIEQISAPRARERDAVRSADKVSLGAVTSYLEQLTKLDRYERRALSRRRRALRAICTNIDL